MLVAVSGAPWQRVQVWNPLSLQPCLRQLWRRRQAIGRKCAGSRHSLEVAAAAVEPPPAAVTSYDALVRWCIERHQLPPLAVEAGLLDAEPGTQRAGFLATKEVAVGEAVLQIPSSLAITSIDVFKCPQLATLAEGRSELVGLALWLMQERSKGGASEWSILLQTLPQATLTPILWSDDERQHLLRGSPVLEESRAREQALCQEWKDIQAVVATSNASMFASVHFNERAFMEAMSVVLAHAAYLPSAQCFALLPLVGAFHRTGSSAGAVLDYDLEAEAVTLVAQRTYSPGQEVAVFDGRPNGELLLATGTMEMGNPTDCLFMEASLVAADRLFTAKREIVESIGLGVKAEFPVFEDRIATQHLVYLRLARLQDPAQLARINFEQDVVISPENEYEILQLLMSDLRDRFQAYSSEFDEDVKDLQRPDLTPKQRLAAQLRLTEKRILRGTMDGVRRRLAPIRGIPTKSGALQDPNEDLNEIFSTLEALPSTPKKLLENFNRWWSGKDDPEWRR